MMAELQAIAEAEERELLFMRALDAAYNLGKLNYVHFSAARDATEARFAALGWYREHIEGQNLPPPPSGEE